MIFMMMENSEDTQNVVVVLLEKSDWRIGKIREEICNMKKYYKYLKYLKRFGKKYYYENI